jgi:hypothetical protein
MVCKGHVMTQGDTSWGKCQVFEDNGGEVEIVLAGMPVNVLSAIRRLIYGLYFIRRLRRLLKTKSIIKIPADVI